MSQMFVQRLAGKTEDGKKLEMYVYPEDLINYNKCIALFVPEIETSYQRTVLECAINFLSKYIAKVGSSPDYDLQNTPEGINEDITIALGQVADSLQYLINSSSWKSNKLKPYDVDEICNKLDFAQKIFKNTLNRK